jgi:hypothetical protein
MVGGQGGEGGAETRQRQSCVCSGAAPSCLFCLCCPVLCWVRRQAGRRWPGTTMPVNAGERRHPPPPPSYPHPHASPCRRWRPFIWEERAGGSAYSATIGSLRKRLSSRLAGFSTARKC